MAKTRLFFPLAPNKKHVKSPFGPRSRELSPANGYHYGVDYGANIGTPVRAALAGVIVGRSNNNTSAGNTVIIKHNNADAPYTAYYHLSKVHYPVKSAVKQGEVIGLAGNTDGGTNTSTGPHLHFMVCRQISGVWPVKSTCIDPESFQFITALPKPKPEPDPEPKPVIYRVTAVWLYKRATPAGKKLGKVYRNGIVAVTRISGDWAQDKTGFWVSTKYLKKV